MVRVLYIGVADLARPTSGLDLASRSHFEEISDDPRLAVTAVSVSPMAIDPAVPTRRPAYLFASDMLTVRSRSERLLKKLALLVRGGILFHSGLISDPARAMLRHHLATGPDVVLIDNVGALGNVALLRLLAIRLRRRSKIMVVAHDASADILRDRASVQKSRPRALAIRLHALHCKLYESAVFSLAHRVIFLSQPDRDRFRFLPLTKTDAMCLIVDEPQVETGPIPEWPSDYLIFIGSPIFFANAYAIEWLTNAFAPKLLAAMPDLQLLLVGKGTDDPAIIRPTNMVGLGFVDADRLQRLLRGSLGLLSPVIHGSGIKIKVLEAIAAGCAIFATELSLRGFEFMTLEPMLDLNDPEGSTARVCAIVGDPVRLAKYKRSIEKRWETYKHDRRGKLADAVYALAKGELTTKTRPLSLSENPA